ncbi:hypothetical protein QVD17_37985 [Tagetes erecta]|uniref:Uncharacterized protein n=1 Tax=Tagetes erecta TaxID=13708 RepID=A0AAD8NKA9_TARER|nr:hypothetical protein QVD17_37985 [Tagetes erecta]
MMCDQLEQQNTAVETRCADEKQQQNNSNVWDEQQQQHVCCSHVHAMIMNSNLQTVNEQLQHLQQKRGHVATGRAYTYILRTVLNRNKLQIAQQQTDSNLHQH